MRNVASGPTWNVCAIWSEVGLEGTFRKHMRQNGVVPVPAPVIVKFHVVLGGVAAPFGSRPGSGA